MDSVGAVGADDDRLLDVGGPRRAGDEEYRARRLAHLARAGARRTPPSCRRCARVRTTQTCVSGSSAVTFGVAGDDSSSTVPVSAMAQKQPVSPVASSPGGRAVVERDARPRPVEARELAPADDAALEPDGGEIARHLGGNVRAPTPRSRASCPAGRIPCGTARAGPAHARTRGCGPTSWRAIASRTSAISASVGSAPGAPLRLADPREDVFPSAHARRRVIALRSPYNSRNVFPAGAGMSRPFVQPSMPGRRVDAAFAPAQPVRDARPDPRAAARRARAARPRSSRARSPARSGHGRSLRSNCCSRSLRMRSGSGIFTGQATAHSPQKVAALGRSPAFSRPT